jgi:hypothetical protein
LFTLFFVVVVSLDPDKIANNYIKIMNLFSKHLNILGGKKIDTGTPTL